VTISHRVNASKGLNLYLSAGWEAIKGGMEEWNSRISKIYSIVFLRYSHHSNSTENAIISSFLIAYFLSDYSMIQYRSTTT